MSETAAFITCAEEAVGGVYCSPPNEPNCTDCSGLVKRCYRNATDKAITGSSWDLAGMGERVPVGSHRPGDVLVYGNGAHVGIVVGQNRAVHALNDQLGIRETKIDGANLGPPLTGVRRLPLKGKLPDVPDRRGAAVGVAQVTESSPYRLLGNTTRAAFRDALARTVGPPSPMLPETDAIYDVLFPHGLTRLAAPMCWHERKNDTHEPSYSYYGPEFHNAWAVTGGTGGNRFKRYGSYAEAAADWAPQVLSETYARAGSIREFITIYAPPFENDTEGYIRYVVNAVNALPLITGEPTVPVPWSPIIYDLATDAHAQRFGLAPWEADRILAKHGGARRPEDIQAIQLHVQWGNTPGSLRHWLGVSASSTVMVQRDGSILRVIPELRVPWTGGDVKSPDAQARRLMDRFGWDPNQYSLTIEAEDERTEAINAAQEKTIVWLIRQWQGKYAGLAGSDWADRILGHLQINAVDKRNCGKYKPQIVQALSGTAPIPEPEPTAPNLPAWLPLDALAHAFPLLDTTGQGVVTKAVIAWTAEHGELPWFVGKTDLGSGRNVWRFDRVTFFNDGATVWQEGQAA